MNSLPIPSGIEELEDYSNSSQAELSIIKPGINNLIKKHLKVTVHEFCFTRASIKAVLSGVWTGMINKLLHVQDHIKNISSDQENLSLIDIDTLHPKVVETASKLFKEGNYRNALLDTYIMLVDYVKTKSGRHKPR